MRRGEGRKEARIGLSLGGWRGERTSATCAMGPFPALAAAALIALGRGGGEGRGEGFVEGAVRVAGEWSEPRNCASSFS